jgi:Mycobacterial methylenetetrahydrofolate reductase
MIEEDGDRPLEMKPKMDVLEFWKIVKPELPGVWQPLVADEQAFVRKLAETEPTKKRKLMIDLYERVIDGVAELGFPISIHLEAPTEFRRRRSRPSRKCSPTGHPNSASGESPSRPAGSSRPTRCRAPATRPARDAVRRCPTTRRRRSPA